MDKDLISRSALLFALRNEYLPAKGEFARAMDIARFAIYDAPAVDAVEVVRCRDCVHRHTNPHCHGRPMDWYCPNGERRRRDE